MGTKIGVLVVPPYATNCALNAKCLERGFAMDAAVIACEYLKINCTFTIYPGEVGQANDLGQGTGLIGTVQKGELALTLPFVTQNYRRSLAVAFSASYFYSDIVLATRIPKTSQETVNWNFLYAFQWPVILVFLFALVVVALLITGVSSNTRRNSFSCISLFFHNCSALITQKYTPSVLNFTLLRPLIATWALALVVLGSIYVNLLISRKVVQSNNLPFTTFDTFVNCLEDKRCRFITYDLTANSYQLLIAPGLEWSARINKALIDNPTVVAPADKIPGIILKEKNQFLVWPWIKEGILYNINSRRESICDFYIMGTESRHGIAFAMRRNSSILSKLNELGLIFQENGLGEKLQQKYMYKIHNACDNVGKRFASDAKEEKLSSFVTVFSFYGCGILLAMCGFVIELVISFIFEKLAFFSVLTRAIR